VTLSIEDIEAYIQMCVADEVASARASTTTMPAVSFNSVKDTVKSGMTGTLGSICFGAALSWLMLGAMAPPLQAEKKTTRVGGGGGVVADIASLQRLFASSAFPAPTPTASVSSSSLPTSSSSCPVAVA
jgi:hypothetical protein